MPELVCDKMEQLTDEYFHGELSPEDMREVDRHVKGCEACAVYFENERRYFQAVRLAAYNADIAGAVMDRIIDGRLIVDAPAKKRYIPFGLISAAVIVLVMLVMSRDTLDLFDRAANEGYAVPAEYDIYDAVRPEIRARGFAGDWADDMAVEVEEDGAVVFRDDAVPFEQDAFGLEAAPRSELAVPATMPEALMLAGEIIRLRREAAFLIPETEYGPVLITREQLALLIEDLERYGIYFELESTGIDSEFAQIIYID